MEIARVSGQSIKIKGKQVSILVNPLEDKVKTGADIALFFSRSSQTFDREAVEGLKLVIDGPGEYELGGVKITGEKSNQEYYYLVTVDGISLVLGRVSSFSKVKDSLQEAQILCLLADGLANQSVITAVNSTILLFYGEKAEDNVKALGKEDLESSSKFVITREKIPTETQVVWLQ